MSVVGGEELFRMWMRNELIINPVSREAFQPNSIDVRLGDTVKQSAPEPLKVYRFYEPPPPYNEYDTVSRGFVLYPGEFVLGVTREYFEVPDDYTCTFENRSSVGRMGIVTVNAGRVDTGWRGNLTLEILNTEKFPVLLQYEMPIGQLVFSSVEGTCIPYGSAGLRSKYQDDTIAQPRKLSV